MPLAAELPLPPEPGSARTQVAADTGPNAARLSAMVREHFDSIWRLLRRLGLPASTVDDAAQEVFVVAARRIDVVARGSEKSYLFGTALRVAQSTRRKLAREGQRGAPLPEELAGEHETPEALLDKRRGLELLDELLGRLEESERSVFVLFELEGLTLTEISRVLAVPRGTVASRLKRARERFERALATRTGRAYSTRGHHD